MAGFEKTVAQTYGANALNLYKQYLAASGTTKTKMGKNGTVAAVKKYAEMFGEKNAAFKKSYGKKK